MSLTTITALGLLAAALAALWHLGVRATRPRPADPRQADNDTIRAAIQAARSMAATLEQRSAADPAQAAILLATVVRAKQPADDLGASSSLLDALDQAAAYLREILPQPVPVTPTIRPGATHPVQLGNGNWVDIPCDCDPSGHEADPVMRDDTDDEEPVSADPPTWPLLTDAAQQRLRASTFTPSDDPAKSEDGAG